MFLDPRYASVPEKENRPRAAGVGCLSSSLPQMLLDRSSRAFSDATECGLQRKVMQIVPISGK
jgi:hypothetical protein